MKFLDGITSAKAIPALAESLYFTPQFYKYFQRITEKNLIHLGHVICFWKTAAILGESKRFLLVLIYS